jgi:hypothetical protein
MKLDKVTNNFLIKALIVVCILAFLQLCIHGICNFNRKRELFTGSPLKNEPILKTSMTYEEHPIMTIYRSPYDNSVKLEKMSKASNNIKVVKTLIGLDGKDMSRLDNRQSFYYTDAFTYNKYFKNFIVITMCSSPKNLLLISNSNKPLLDSEEIQKVGGNLTTVGYRTQADVDLFKKVVKSQKKYVNMDGFQFIHLDKDMSDDDIMNKLFEEKTIDILVYLGTISNSFMNKVKQHDYNLVSYQDLDMNILKYYVPFAKRKIQTLSSNRKNENQTSDNALLIYNTLLIDTLIFSTHSQITEIESGNNDNITDDLRQKYLDSYQYILETFNEFLKINYYMQFFEFMKISNKWALKKQDSASFQNIFDKKDRITQQNQEMTSQENFSNSNTNGIGIGLGLREDVVGLNGGFTKENLSRKFMSFKIGKRDLIPLKHENDLVRYKINKTLINGVPIKTGDKLYTDSGLGNFAERTRYYVVLANANTSKNVEAESAIRLEITKNDWENRDVKDSFYYINLNDQQVSDKNIEKNDLIYLTMTGINSIETSDPGAIPDSINKVGIVLDKNEEDAIMEKNLKIDGENEPLRKYHPKIEQVKKPQLMIRVDDDSPKTKEVNKKKDRFEPEYRCYQDNTILTRNECVDPVDFAGREKPSYNWDRPCVKDTECPFYLEGEAPDRGKCNNGFCEFPVGIKRKSYREYDKNFRENNYPRCANNKCQDLSWQETVKCCAQTKDYIFQGDQEDRRLKEFY